MLSIQVFLNLIIDKKILVFFKILISTVMPCNPNTVTITEVFDLTFELLYGRLNIVIEEIVADSITVKP